MSYGRGVQTMNYGAAMNLQARGVDVVGWVVDGKRSSRSIQESWLRRKTCRSRFVDAQHCLQASLERVSPSLVLRP
jgi:hypothetical protein